MLSAHLVVIFAAILTASVDGQRCPQHSADFAGDRSRRESAIRYIVAVNVAEARAHREIGQYMPLSNLEGVPNAPVGFIPKLLFDQWSYVITLKDYFDACGLSFFSDEQGVIYEAHPRALPSSTSQEPSRDDSVASPDKGEQREQP